MLITFSIQGFRCFSSEATLDLTSSALKTVVPRAGQTWVDATERVAAIYGANASGKTTVLEALWALAGALRYPGSGGLRQASAMLSSGKPVRYQVEFVSNGVRYDYEVRVQAWGVEFESLHAYPKGSRRLLFRRSQSEHDGVMTFEKGASLTGPTAEVVKITTQRTLFLATARRFNHSVLAQISRTLTQDLGIHFVSYRDKQDEDVLHRVLLEMLNASQEQLGLVNALLRAADIGVCGLKVQRDKVPQEVIERVKRVVAALREGDGEFDVDESIPRVLDVFLFEHHGQAGGTFTLPISAESSGTLTWLSTVWHAVDALQRGSLLLVDELDASLHPELARFVVSLFLNGELNARGAQLIFTTHDVSLLGNAPSKLLEAQQVWFVEKSSTGESELFSLSDFETRSGNNNERRYLAGQFGAVPSLDDSELLRFIARQPSRESVNA